MVDALPIPSSDWFRERELGFGALLRELELDAADRPGLIEFDLTGLVAEWIDGTRRNSGVMLKLSADYEDFGVSGPSLPSSTFAPPTCGPSWRSRA